MCSRWSSRMPPRPTARLRRLRRRRRRMVGAWRRMRYCEEWEKGRIRVCCGFLALGLISEGRLRLLQRLFLRALRQTVLPGSDYANFFWS